MMKEIWIFFGTIGLVVLLAAIIVSACVFVAKVWEYVNTDSNMHIRGNVTITPNSEGEVMLGGTFTMYESMEITGSNVNVDGGGKTTLKKKGKKDDLDPAIKVKKGNTNIKNMIIKRVN